MRAPIAIAVVSAIVVILVAGVLMPVLNEASDSGDKTLDVIVLAGQSNIAYNPYRVNVDVVNEDVEVPDSDCYFYGTTYPPQFQVTDLQDCGFKNMILDDKWVIGGEEPAIAYEIASHTNDDVYLINVGKGGYAISQFIPGTECGDWMEDVVIDALSKVPSGYKINTVGWIWCQGESDKTTPVSSYVTNFDKIAAFFSSYGFKKCYMVETKPSDSGNATDAQKLIVKTHPDVVMASTAPASFTVDNGLLISGDTLHYSQLGRDIVGEDCGNAIANDLPVHFRENNMSGILMAIPVMIFVALLLGITLATIGHRQY